MHGSPDPRLDLLRYYDAYFQPGMVDLSASCPPPRPIAMPGEDSARGGLLEFVPPAGAPALREAIAARYERLTADDIVIAAGASEALAAVALALLRPGARAAVDTGVYASFTETAQAIGASLAPDSPLAPGTTVVAVCNPTTPAGRIRDMATLCEEARAVGAVVVADEVYRDLVCEGRISAAADIDSGAVSVGDISKPLGLGALRIGWTATRDGDLRSRLDRQLQLLSGGPSALSVQAALSAFDTFDQSVRETMCAARVNGAAVLDALDARGWTYSRPEAGLTVQAWPPRPVSPRHEARLREAGLFLIPCHMYGAPGAYRFSMLAPVHEVCRALALLVD